MYIKKACSRAAPCSVPRAPPTPSAAAQVRKLPMYGTTLFHVHNSKIFPSGHFLIAANSSGVQFLHPVTKEELHSPFFFSDLQRWEYTPKVFCFWSTKCDFLEEDHQGRHIVKYSLSTKQGWEISSTLHSCTPHPVRQQRFNRREAKTHA